MSTRLERALQLLEAQQGQIGRLEQEVGSLRTAFTSASAVTESSLSNGASQTGPGVAAQASFNLQLDARFEDLKKTLDKSSIISFLFYFAFNARFSTSCSL